MSDYEQYTIQASALGDPVDQEAVDRFNALVAEEVAAAGLEGRARVVATLQVGANPQFIPYWDEELRAVVDRACERLWTGEGQEVK